MIVVKIVFDSVKNYKLCNVKDGRYHICMERISDISLLNIKMVFFSKQIDILVIHCDDQDIIDTIRERYGKYCGI